MIVNSVQHEQFLYDSIANITSHRQPLYSIKLYLYRETEKLLSKLIPKLFCTRVFYYLAVHYIEYTDSVD